MKGRAAIGLVRSKRNQKSRFSGGMFADGPSKSLSGIDLQLRFGEKETFVRYQQTMRRGEITRPLTT